MCFDHLQRKHGVISVFPDGASEWPSKFLTCSGHTLVGDPLVLWPQAGCLSTKSKEAFAGHSGRITRGASITTWLWCNEKTQDRKMRKGESCGESQEQTSPKVMEKRKPQVQSLLWLQWNVWGKEGFSGLMWLCFISVLPQANQDPGFILNYEKCFLITACFLMQEGKEKWGRGKKIRFEHLCFNGNVGLCFCPPGACFRAFICGNQERQQCGWFPRNSALEWEICFGNIEPAATKETVEHGQGMITDIKKCMLVQRKVAPSKQETNPQEMHQNV